MRAVVLAALFATAIGGGAAPAAIALPDERGWELVSPVDKNGGQDLRSTWSRSWFHSSCEIACSPPAVSMSY